MGTDQDFLASFCACSLPSSEFDHRGHIRAAWLYLAQWSPEEATERLSADIQRYASRLGAEGKFHRTITEAMMRLLASHLPEEAELTWEALIERHPIVVEDARGLLRHFYSEQRLSDPEARTHFLPPDRNPFP